MNYKLINPEYLDSIAGDDASLISEIVVMFKAQSAEIYEEMKALNARKEYKLLGMLAHKAKSSVAIIGMNDLAVMLKTFELSAKEEKDQELYESYIERFGSDTRSAISECDDLVNDRMNKTR